MTSVITRGLGLGMFQNERGQQTYAIVNTFRYIGVMIPSIAFTSS